MKELALHVLDLVQNSLAAGATDVGIIIKEDLKSNQLLLTVQDNGKGMSPEMCTKVLDPFVTSRTTRKVGMGLPLLKFAAEQAAGQLQLHSSEGIGTTVEAVFQYDHIDRAPLGDMASTLVGMIALNEDCRFRYLHSKDSKEFRLDSDQIKQVLGDVPLGHPQVVAWLGEYIRENEQTLEV